MWLLENTELTRWLVFVAHYYYCFSDSTALDLLKDCFLSQAPISCIQVQLKGGWGGPWASLGLAPSLGALPGTELRCQGFLVC